MAMRTGEGRMSGVLIPDRLTGSRDNVGISSYALCSIFREEGDLVIASGNDRYFISRRLADALSATVADVSWDHLQIELQSGHVDRLVRLFQGETVVLGGEFDISATIAELKLRGFGAVAGRKEAEGFRLSLEPEFVRECFGEATLRVNGKEVKVSGAGLLLLRCSELMLEETPALDELISLLRLERVVPGEVSALREVVRRVGLECAIDLAAAVLLPSWRTCSSSRRW
jgi:hypothetical protein